MNLWCRGQLSRPRRQTTRLCFAGRQSERLLNHSFGAEQLLASASLDRLTYARHRVVDQKLQHPHVASCAADGAMIFLKLRAERSEASRELPFSVHRSMVKGPRFAVQSRKIVQWVKNYSVRL